MAAARGVPRSAFAPDKSPHPADDEAFQMLRASLTYFNVDQPIASVAVISPLAEDGKTTVAVGLARALARAGKHVILLGRRPPPSPGCSAHRPSPRARIGRRPCGGARPRGRAR